ncbi:unnamed protein product [Phytophthora lilii]|uniref:RxLR effector protein n=1 Tax=Phytophthora lilii TaxID=2077276 RepID=A0A9W6WHX0_9STRA|nr:unnamed protein product [Phytophthora lilii]
MCRSTICGSPNQSARVEPTTVFFIVSHFTIHFPRHKPPNNSRPMRLNGVLVATILVLVASVNFARAASDATVVKLPKVMNSADAHEVMGNNRRLLRTHKPANTEKGEEERGFADVVIEAMTKQKVDKVLAELMKSKSTAALKKVDDIKVLKQLDDMVQPTILNPIFKHIDEILGITPNEMARQLNTRRDLTIDEQNVLLYMYTTYCCHAGPEHAPRAFKGSSSSWSKVGDGKVIINFTSSDTEDVTVNIMSGGDKVDEVDVAAGGTATWVSNTKVLGGKTLYLDRWRPGFLSLPGTGGGSLVLWVPRASQGGHLELNATLNVS